MYVIGNKKYQRQGLLLGIIYLFSPIAKEISLSRLQTHLKDCEWKSQLECYSFEGLNDADELLLDLEELSDKGLINEISYHYDARSPERYFKLTRSGIGRGKKMVSRFSTDMLEYLEYICEKSVS